MSLKLPGSWTSTKESRPEVVRIIILTLWIATLSGPKYWNPASSDILIKDTNRSVPLIIKQARNEWSEKRTTFDPRFAWNWVVVKLKQISSKWSALLAHLEIKQFNDYFELIANLTDSIVLNTSIIVSSILKVL